MARSLLCSQTKEHIELCNNFLQVFSCPFLVSKYLTLKFAIGYLWNYNSLGTSSLKLQTTRFQRAHNILNVVLCFKPRYSWSNYRQTNQFVSSSKKSHWIEPVFILFHVILCFTFDAFNLAFVKVSMSHGKNKSTYTRISYKTMCPDFNRLFSANDWHL